MTTITSRRRASRATVAPIGPAGRQPAAHPRRQATGQPSTLHDMALAFVRLYLEVEAGLRPWSTMRGVVHPHLLLRLVPVWVRPTPVPARIVTFTGARTAPDTYEGVGIVRRDARCGAIAVQLRRRHGGWLVADAVRPEDGPLPGPPFDVEDDERDEDLRPLIQPG